MFFFVDSLNFLRKKRLKLRKEFSEDNKFHFYTSLSREYII